MKIGTRLIIGFGVCLFFMLLLGVFSLYELNGIVAKSGSVITVDSKVVEDAQRMRANINMMRRYEKDAFMAIPDLAKVDEYILKWNEAREHAKKRMEELVKLEQEVKDKETLLSINKSMDSYEAGFKKVTAQIKTGTISSAEDANKAINEFKGSAHQAEKSITEYAMSNDDTMIKAKKSLMLKTIMSLFLRHQYS